MTRAHYIVIREDRLQAFRDPDGARLLGATIFCGLDPCLRRARAARVRLVRDVRLGPIDDVGDDPLRLPDDPAVLLDLDRAIALVHGPPPIRQLAGAGAGAAQWAGWSLRCVTSVAALTRYLVARPLTARSPDGR